MQYPSSRALQACKCGSIHSRPHDLGGSTINMGNYVDVRPARPDLQGHDDMGKHARNRPHAWKQSLTSHHLGPHDGDYISIGSPNRQRRSRSRSCPAAYPRTWRPSPQPQARLLRAMEENPRRRHIRRDSAEQERHHTPQSQPLLGRVPHKLQRFLVRSGACIRETGERRCDARRTGRRLHSHVRDAQDDECKDEDEGRRI